MSYILLSRYLKFQNTFIFKCTLGSNVNSDSYCTLYKAYYFRGAKCCLYDNIRIGSSLFGWKQRPNPIRVQISSDLPTRLGKEPKSGPSCRDEGRWGEKCVIIRGAIRIMSILSTRNGTIFQEN